MDDPAPYGSAVGIPGPPDAPSGRSYVDRPPPPRSSGRRRRSVWLIVVPVVVVAIVLGNRSSSSNTSKIDGLAIGDCLVVPSGDIFDISNIEVVDCSKPHNNEVYAIGTLTSSIDSTTNAEDNPEIVRICRTEVDPKILAVLAHTQGVEPGVITRKDKAGRLVCTANTASRTGSLLASVTA